MSEEEAQVFRGDHQPEVAAADNHAVKRAKPASGPSDQRAVTDQEHGPSDVRALHDASGTAEQHALHDGEGAADVRQMSDGSGPSDQREMHDGEGPVLHHESNDAQGPLLHHASQDAEGPSQQRQLTDHIVALPDELGEAEAELAADAPPAAPWIDPAVLAAQELDLKEEDYTTPWALSIHLEERIKNLSTMTAKVSAQLEGLEDAVNKLSKRIGK